MEIKAKVSQVLPMKTGVSAKGEWKTQEVIISWSDGAFEKHLLVSARNDKADMLAKLTVGQEGLFHLNISSREYNGKWFTSAEAWKWEMDKTTNF